MALNKYLLCARVVGTHGVRGVLRLENHTDSPKVLAGLKTVYLKKGDEYSPVKIEKASVQKEAVLAKAVGVDTLEDAITWKGRELYADRDDFNLNEGGFFVADIIGLDVLDAVSGEKIGFVKEVLTGRIQDIFVIQDVRGGSFMLPRVDDFVKSVDVNGDNPCVKVSLIEGIRGDA